MIFEANKAQKQLLLPKLQENSTERQISLVLFKFLQKNNINDVALQDFSNFSDILKYSSNEPKFSPVISLNNKPKQKCVQIFIINDLLIDDKLLEHHDVGAKILFVLARKLNHKTEAKEFLSNIYDKGFLNINLIAFHKKHVKILW